MPRAGGPTVATAAMAAAWLGGNGAPGGILITYSYSTEPLPPVSFPGAIIPFL